MSILVRAYSCQFKCGRRVTTKRKSMDAHESRCFHNPTNRACQSCGNFQEEYDTIYVPHFTTEVGDLDYDVKVHYCAADIDIKEALQNNCPKWIPPQPCAGESAPELGANPMPTSTHMSSVHQNIIC